MTVLVRVPRRFTAQVRSDLIDRNAHAVEVESGPLSSIVRTQAPQTNRTGLLCFLPIGAGLVTRTDADAKQTAQHNRRSATLSGPTTLPGSGQVQYSPCAVIASATFTKPAMLAPST